MQNLQEIIDFNQKFVEDCLKKQKNIIPQIVVNHNGKISVIVMVGIGRNEIKSVLKLLEKSRPKWLAFISEGYMRTFEKKENLADYKYGELQERFKKGDKSVKEVVIIQAYSKTQKLMRIVDKETLKPIRETENFEGFLTISDIERVFWSE